MDISTNNDNPNPATGQPGTGAVSLELLLDTLDALETEVGELPDPAPLFASDLRVTLVEALGVVE